ncbi:hypothetical protein [Burkholderia cepacia]|uniref:hypothetical protein n=1 Tax=Burkholderia cepacia TaxID=292 RepID=UPI0012D3CFA2|nr:hypothetical protein [Burkholderia cepacia]
MVSIESRPTKLRTLSRLQPLASADIHPANGLQRAANLTLRDREKVASRPGTADRDESARVASSLDQLRVGVGIHGTRLAPYALDTLRATLVAGQAMRIQKDKRPIDWKKQAIGGHRAVDCSPSVIELVEPATVATRMAFRAEVLPSNCLYKLSIGTAAG